MVLQRGQAVKLWGWAAPESIVTISLPHQSVQVKASSECRWQIMLKPLELQAPFTMRVSSESDTIELENIVVGDVFFCSGQSNMEWMVKDSLNAEHEIAETQDNGIRLLQVPKRVTNEPADDLPEGTAWQVLSPETVPEFSAVAYFFAKELRKHNSDVPIGLIHASWGGSPIYTWMTESTVKADELALTHLKNAQARGLDFEAVSRQDLINDEVRFKLEQELLATPPGEVATLEFDDSSWESMRIPAYWHQAGMQGYEGFVWYRKTVTLTAEQAAQPLLLDLGYIERRDQAFVNGVEVGSMDGTEERRRYDIPDGLMHEGDNIIALRDVHTWDWGGGMFRGPHQLENSETGEVLVDLSGEWKYSTTHEPEFPFVGRTAFVPAMCFNGMVNPVIPYSLAGFLWYQGEANAHEASHYARMLKSMVGDWRKRWELPEAPFFFVQLANWQMQPSEPTTDDWAKLREAQTKAQDEISRAYMALAIDIGEAKDIHPKNKQDVGKRLALWARRELWGEDVCASGPVYQKHECSGSAIRLFFDHADGLHARGGAHRSFAIAGEDKNFVWADAVIEGSTIIVSANEVPQP